MTTTTMRNYLSLYIRVRQVYVTQKCDFEIVNTLTFMDIYGLWNGNSVAAQAEHGRRYPRTPGRHLPNRQVKINVHKHLRE